MKKLLKEFTKKDANEVLKDDELFQIAYEIELEADTEQFGKDPSMFMDEAQEYVRNTFDEADLNDILKRVNFNEVYSGDVINDSNIDYNDDLFLELKEHLKVLIDRDDELLLRFKKFFKNNPEFNVNLSEPAEIADTAEEFLESEIDFDELVSIIGTDTIDDFLIGYYESWLDEILPEYIKTKKDLDNISMFLDELEINDPDGVINEIAKKVNEMMEEEIQNRIIEMADQMSEEGGGSADINELFIKFEDEFPNFMGKWGSGLTYSSDESLENGIEIKQKMFITGIRNAFDFLDDFQEDFENQDIFVFSRRTGIHTNVSIKGDYSLQDWNLIKGILLLSEDVALQGFDPRRGTGSYAKFFKPIIINFLLNSASKTELRDVRKLIADNLDDFEKSINSQIYGMSDKYYGFNISHLPSRMEFRYPGGEITDITLLKRSTLYYCYITNCMLNPSFKQEQYLNKLYKFVASLVEEAKNKKENLKNLPKR